MLNFLSHKLLRILIDKGLVRLRNSDDGWGLIGSHSYHAIIISAVSPAALSSLIKEEIARCLSVFSEYRKEKDERLQASWARVKPSEIHFEKLRDVKDGEVAFELIATGIPLEHVTNVLALVKEKLDQQIDVSSKLHGIKVEIENLDDVDITPSMIVDKRLFRMVNISHRILLSDIDPQQVDLIVKTIKWLGVKYEAIPVLFKI